MQCLEILKREFGAKPEDEKEKPNTFTWSTRENEWYISERRFIFSCKSEKERKKWITEIKKAVGVAKEKFKEEQNLKRQERS